MPQIDPVTLIVTALTTGASAGALETLTDEVKESVKAAYGKLHELVRRRLRGTSGAEGILAEYQADPGTYEAPLAKKLTEAGAGDDADLVAAARTLMELVDQRGAKSGKYSLTIMSSKGVQIGDGNRQVNHF